MQQLVPSRINRRTAIQLGVLGGGLTLSQFLRATAAGAGEPQDSSRSAVLVFLKGGPSHQDTFDLKPDAPSEYRGTFRPIKTTVPGMQICEHLPALANQAKHYSIVRGITHNLADHGIGTTYLLTGNRPTPTVEYPMYGSVVSHQFPSRPELPSFVSIDRPLEGPGFLGPEFGPLSTGEKPRHGVPFRVRGISLDEGMTIERYRSRRALNEDLDTFFGDRLESDPQVRGMDRFSRQAFEMISSPRSRAAFDLQQEPHSEVDRFGTHEFGQSLLMTARLIEAGVRFVTVILEDWDTHQDNFNQLAGRLLPQLDQSLSAFLERLRQRGRFESTSIMVTGEFGRTPKVNDKSGRDHWARAMTAILAGGGIQTGQVAGATDATASEPEGTGFTPDDLAATFYRSIGIDPKHEFTANVGRPITLVRDGQPITDLLRS